jgi:ERCC4-related helicase
LSTTESTIVTPTITAYQAKYLAYDLTRRYPSNSYERFGESLSNAQVDLNPHQVEAAYFAFKSPLSNGAILADEVGLGKTIEAGILLSQKWAERKRKLLIIVPSNLRKQWSQELQEKFFLPSLILENASLKAELKKKNFNPFEQANNIVICSYHFARKQGHYIEPVDWDLVVIDEAHRLRNVYKPNSKIANEIKSSLSRFQKVLLTATPLQNSLMELFGLVSIVDEYAFGDLKSFKAQYSRFDPETGNYDELKRRLAPVCQRTLRRQVMEYIKYTSRKAIVQEFIPSEAEQQLYRDVVDFLRRDRLFSLPQSQRSLLTLILLKLQSSSTFAITPTFEGLIEKLKELKKVLVQPEAEVYELFREQTENFDNVQEEWLDDEEDSEDGDNKRKREVRLTIDDIPQIDAEIEALNEMLVLGRSIDKNSKGDNLVTALTKGFDAIDHSVSIDGTGKKANRKAIIFTESVRTQKYIQQLLENTEFKGESVLFNGTNSDPQSNEIYKAWMERHHGTDMITGSKTADKRAAIVEYFRDKATVMIATEAAAEGINLQFCSLILNFDMPWNPQRIEQRIGRCHRYGQKHDVVVVNFLNKNNAADTRVYELLAQKFKLFDGVFGSSDEVLGSIESGVELEKRIVEIYKNCRTAEEIQSAFDLLQRDLEPQIEDKMQKARQTLLENFDDEVLQKVKMNVAAFLSKYENQLWLLTYYALKGRAEFNEDRKQFSLALNPYNEQGIDTGTYRLARHVEGAHIYRIGHPLAQAIIEEAKSSELPVVELVFDCTNHRPRMAALEPFIGMSGWLRASTVTIDTFESEDYILMAACTDDGLWLSSDVAAKLMLLNAQILPPTNIQQEISQALDHKLQNQQGKVLEESEDRNGTYFDEEMIKLEKWADDKKTGLEIQIKDIDKQIRLYKNEVRKISQLSEKVKMQREIKDLEKKRSDLRNTYFSAQDEIDTKKEQLIASVEARLKHRIDSKELFTIRWSII